MKRKLFNLAVFAATAAFAVCGIAACQRKPKTTPVDPDDPPLPDIGETVTAAVDAESIFVRETRSSFTVSWGEVADVTNYVFSFSGASVGTGTMPFINLYEHAEFTMPSDGNLTFSIVAQTLGKDDSAPTYFTYKAEGVNLDSPKITSFENKKLTWDAVASAAAYSVKVNGQTIDSGNGETYSGTTLDLSSYSGTVSVEIKALCAQETAYIKDSAPTSFSLNLASGKMTMPAASGYKIENGVISWNAVGGAKGYRVVDLNNNVTVVTGTSYQMFNVSDDKLLVTGVYPISSDSLVADADTAEIVNIPYLQGSGTQASPYLIKTPFDLRAIDYYESVYARKLKKGQTAAKNYYKIDNDIDFRVVSVGDGKSNIHTLAAPFYGELDGNNKKLSYVNVSYDGGYWALFDFTVKGSVVKNITFDSPVITNKLQKADAPLGANIATIANRNYGTISGVKVNDANYTSAGGEVCGICTHNYGTVSGCTVSGKLTQGNANLDGQACYEMAGLVIENCSGGNVTGNTVGTLTIKGTALGSGTGAYNNVRTAAGVVAVNRSGGTVSGNSYTSVTLDTVLKSGTEFGGVVAYNAGTLSKGSGNLGTFKVNGATVSAERGGATSAFGKLVGKDDSAS